MAGSDASAPVLKVAHLTSVHAPFDTRIFHRQCVSLAKAGHDVTLICVHDKDEVVNGVEIKALPKPGSRFERAFKTAARLYQAALAEKADVYHFHDPELIPVGMLLKLHGRRVVYDVHEDVPNQVLNKFYIPRVLRRGISWAVAGLEYAGGRLFDHLSVATPTIAARFPAEKTTIIYNFPKLEEFAGEPNEPPVAQRPGTTQFSYIGAISETRGVIELVDAIALVPEGLGATLALGGAIRPPALLDRMQQQPGWARSAFLGWQDRGSVRRVLSDSAAGLVTLHPTPSYLDSYPVKLFEYMAAGLPVIASEFPLWRELVGDAGCCLFVDPLNPQAIADAMTWLLEHPVEARAMGERGREVVHARFTWQVEERKLLALYEGLRPAQPA